MTEVNKNFLKMCMTLMVIGTSKIRGQKAYELIKSR